MAILKVNEVITVCPFTGKKGSWDYQRLFSLGTISVRIFYDEMNILCVFCTMFTFRSDVILNVWHLFSSCSSLLHSFVLFSFEGVVLLSQLSIFHVSFYWPIIGVKLIAHNLMNLLLFIGGRVKTWKRRWFVLTDEFLFYYNAPDVSLLFLILTLCSYDLTLHQITTKAYELSLIFNFKSIMCIGNHIVI